jgi:hypothetical protein
MKITIFKREKGEKKGKLDLKCSNFVGGGNRRTREALNQITALLPASFLTGMGYK